MSGALVKAIELARDAEPERARLQELTRRLRDEVGSHGADDSPIVPVVLGGTDAALAAAARLQERGLNVRAVRPPTVPENSSRLRVVCHAYNTAAEVDELLTALGTETPEEGLPVRPQRTARPLFVAGTDTGIGKTVVSALLARAAASRGAVSYWKPVQTGDDSDTRTVGELAGLAEQLLDEGYAFALPASPHEAAAAEGAAVSPERLDDLLDEHSRRPGTLLAELAGGLLVPLTDGYTQLDWLARRRPSLVLVARSGLGTLNHTLLSLEALRARHLEPRALFLVGERHPSNEATLRRMGGVPQVFEVPVFEPLDTAALDGWLAANDLSAVLAP